MKKACETMLSLYPNQSYPLELLCSHYFGSGKHFQCCLLKPVAYSDAFLSVKFISLTLHVHSNLISCVLFQGLYMKMHSVVSHGFWSWSLAVDQVISVWAQKHCKMEGLKMPLNTLNKVRFFSHVFIFFRKIKTFLKNIKLRIISYPCAH